MKTVLCIILAVVAMGCTGTYKLHVTNASDSKVEINYRIKKGYGIKSKTSTHKTSIKAGKTKKIGKVTPRYNQYGYIVNIDSAAFITKKDTVIYSKTNRIEEKIQLTGHGRNHKYILSFNQ